MKVKEYAHLLTKELKSDSLLNDERESREDTDALARRCSARQTQLIPALRHIPRQSQTGQHPPVRSTSTDADKILALPKNEGCPSQDTPGESGAPYYGQDDEENVVGTGV